MAVLTHSQSKFIEKKIRNYHSLKDDVEEWRQKILAGPKRDERTKRQPQRPADPTGVIAVKLSSPPPHIKEKELWVETIDVALRKLQNTNKGKMFSAYFWVMLPKRVKTVSKELKISERQAHTYINEIIIYIALIAAQKGVFYAEK